MKFTKEEISLCKQVAEKHRKEIKCGDWILRNGELRLNLDGKLAWLEDGKKDIIITITAKEEVAPLWTISDCLEFLEKKGFNHIYSFIHFKDGDWTFTAENSIESNQYKRTRGEKAKTKLEACLKAVLAVVEEEK